MKRVTLQKNIIHFYSNLIFSTLASIVGTSSRWLKICLLQDVSLRDLLGFDPVVLNEKYNLSPNPVGILSFDNFVLETEIAQAMLLKTKPSEISDYFTDDVDPVVKYIEKMVFKIYDGEYRLHFNYQFQKQKLVQKN